MTTVNKQSTFATDENDATYIVDTMSFNSKITAIHSITDATNSNVASNTDDATPFTVENTCADTTSNNSASNINDDQSKCNEGSKELLDQLISIEIQKDCSCNLTFRRINLNPFFISANAPMIELGTMKLMNNFGMNETDKRYSGLALYDSNTDLFLVSGDNFLMNGEKMMLLFGIISAQSASLLYFINFDWFNDEFDDNAIMNDKSELLITDKNICVISIEDFIKLNAVFCPFYPHDKNGVELNDAEVFQRILPKIYRFANQINQQAMKYSLNDDGTAEVNDEVNEEINEDENEKESELLSQSKSTKKESEPRRSGRVYTASLKRNAKVTSGIDDTKPANQTPARSKVPSTRQPKQPKELTKKEIFTRPAKRKIDISYSDQVSKKPSVDSSSCDSKMVYSPFNGNKDVLNMFEKQNDQYCNIFNQLLINQKETSERAEKMLCTSYEVATKAQNYAIESKAEATASKNEATASKIEASIFKAQAEAYKDMLMLQYKATHKERKLTYGHMENMQKILNGK